MFGIYSPDPKIQEGELFLSPTVGDTYKRVLKEHSFFKINRIIENDTFEDSSSVYERFFLDCEAEIHIIARGLKSEIFGRTNVIHAANIFLSRANTKLKLSLRARDNQEKYALHTSEFFRAISDMTSGTSKLETKFYGEEADKPFLGDLPSVTFGDHRMYRVRTFQGNGDYSTHANADVNFNDPQKVKALEAQFDEQLKKETELA